jgi:16S rRNA (guanine966-N2)-methyltransferase
MRVIAGQFRSRQLKSLKGPALRPTSDRLRETLFNILSPRIEGSRFLDLFAGTGAVGIEAVSRSAAFVVFVESHPPAARLIAANLAALGVVEGVRVMNAAAVAAVAKLAAEGLGPFDCVFLDPPYAQESDYGATLEALDEARLVAESGVVIVEHRKSFALPARVGDLEQFRRLRQGDASLGFYRRTAPAG